MTLNSRLASAAAAMVMRIISRRSPLVFLPVLPFKKGSIGATVIFAILLLKRRRERRGALCKSDMCSMELRVSAGIIPN
jgi:hypothetical protein